MAWTAPLLGGGPVQCRSGPQRCMKLRLWSDEMCSTVAVLVRSPCEPDGDNTGARAPHSRAGKKLTIYSLT